MRQILQDLRTGEVSLAETPRPVAQPGTVIVTTSTSLVSAGTERMLLDFGKAGWLKKAQSQPDKVRQVLQKLRADGVLATLESVQSKLDQPLPLGYCSAGIVLEVGAGVTGLTPGDRVACNGPHAELARVPQNLCVRLPDDVDAEAAAFTPLGAVALESVRLVAPSLGECVAVIGLGLIGLLTVQLLRANGCRVIGIDRDQGRLSLARGYGALIVDADSGNLVEQVQSLAGQAGVDAVIVATATTKSEPLTRATQMCRVRGRVVLVGTAGLELSRRELFDKELSIRVSRSYGPGRYDSQYELAGADYPLGYVRWTAKRNFDAFVALLADGKVDTAGLVSHRFDFGDAGRAYELLAGNEPSLGILLGYRDDPAQAASIRLRSEKAAEPRGDRLCVDVIGAGNYASRVLIPALARTGVALGALITTGGAGGVHHGRKHGFSSASSDPDVAFDQPDSPVVIATQHDSHAALVCRALECGKDVFVEKPLAISLAELEDVRRAYEISRRDGMGPRLMVGFNRRFSPAAILAKKLLENRPEPAMFVYTVNAGRLPPQHWLLDPAVGGGRIVGEACHFLDLIRFLSGARFIDASISGLDREAALRLQDAVSIAARLTDGSFASIHYLPNGGKSFPKERLEIFCADGVLSLENFRRLKVYDWPGARSIRSWRQEKGHGPCIAAFVDSIREGLPSPIDFRELYEVTALTIGLAERWSQGQWDWYSIPAH